jgi:hypothetical protein
MSVGLPRAPAAHREHGTAGDVERAARHEHAERDAAVPACDYS